MILRILVAIAQPVCSWNVTGLLSSLQLKSFEV